MCAATARNHSANEAAALAARLTRSLVNAVFQLKESSYAFGIYVVGDRRSTQADCMLQHLAKRQAQLLEFGACQAPRTLERPYARLKKALVGIDISHSGEESLVKQGSLDRQLPSVKEAGESIRLDRERFRAGACECFAFSKIAEFEPAKVSRIDESQLALTREHEARVRVELDGSLRGCDKKTPRHPEMDDPFRAERSSWRRPKLTYDVFSGPMDVEDCAANKTFGLTRRLRLEWLAIPAEPDFQDPVATHACIDAPRDCFHLR